MYWYNNQDFAVKWGSSLSDCFKVSNGVRQGGILSPILFNVFMDELSYLLCSSDVGCHIGSQCINHLFYADDVVLLAPSPMSLSLLLNICEDFSKDSELSYNEKKTVCMCIRSKNYKDLQPTNQFLNGVVLDWVDQYKYLGAVLKSDMSDNRDMERQIRFLYCQGNILIRKFSKCTEHVKIRLFNAYVRCFYCCHLWSNFSNEALHRVKVAYNNVYRRLLGIKGQCSISRKLIEHNLPTLKEVLRKASVSFRERLMKSSNILIVTLVSSLHFMYSSSLSLYWNKSAFVLRGPLL